MYTSTAVPTADNKYPVYTHRIKTENFTSAEIIIILIFNLNPLMYSAFAIELSDLSKPFKFARLKGFERLENCLTKGTYERF